MSNKLKGTLLGILASLVAVVIWVLLEVFAEIMVGYVGILMGLFFILVYKKVNGTDKSNYKYIFGAILLVVEIIASEFIAVAIMAHRLGGTLSMVIGVKEVQTAMLKDILIGLALSLVALFFVIYDEKRREKRLNANAPTSSVPYDVRDLAKNDDENIVEQKEPENKKDDNNF